MRMIVKYLVYSASLSGKTNHVKIIKFLLNSILPNRMGQQWAIKGHELFE